jgi:MFS transporter, DHA1 family, multidrug resistance protein
MRRSGATAAAAGLRRPHVADVPGPADEQQTHRAGRGPAVGSGRAIALIAATAGVGSASSQFWIPFLAFYFLKLGATSDANALFWLGLSLAGQGLGRIVTGPVWGLLADRYGRKVMFIRALYAASVTGFIAGFATQPWHVVAGYALQGAFSGFNPAAVALVSVTVPRERLRSGLAMVTGAQYLGTTVGPALGAIFVGHLGLRGTILAGASLPAFMAILATIFVPRDEVAAGRPAVDGSPAGGSLRPREFLREVSPQFVIPLFLYFALFAGEQVLRTATPIAIKQISHSALPAGDVGWAFTAAGLGSVIGAFGLSRFAVRSQKTRISLTIIITLQALAHIVLARSRSVPVYVLTLGAIFVAQGAMIPSTNTLIAASVSPSWRGTAFGVSASFQALAFAVGPLATAGFATFSLFAVFLAVGALFLAAAVMIFLGLKEPDLTPAGSPRL